jgi:hypothetical protein
MADRPTIPQILARREREVREHYARLSEATQREDWPAEYRRKLADQSIRSIHARNDAARTELRQAVDHARAGVLPRLADGPRLEADELLEANLEVDRYRENPARAAAALRGAIESGATRRIRILGRAALALGAVNPEALGGDRLWARVVETDPEMVAAAGQLDALRKVELIIDADIARERRALMDQSHPEWGRAGVAAKARGQQLGLPPAWATDPSAPSARATLLGDA